MDLADKSAFAAVMATLGDVFRQEITHATTSAYFDALEGYAIGVVRAAARKAIHESRWFPKPADLRETCAEYVRLARQAERETRRALAPPTSATPEDRCPDCGTTVGEHRAEFRALVATINGREWPRRLSDRPSWLELSGVHAIRPQAERWLTDRGLTAETWRAQIVAGQRDGHVAIVPEPR